MSRLSSGQLLPTLDMTARCH